MVRDRLHGRLVVAVLVEAPHGSVQQLPRPLLRRTFGVQAVAVGFHQAWHALGFAEPPGAVGHYLLLHLPLHVGVVLLAVAVAWLVARTPALSLPLALLIAGGALALVAPAARRVRARA